MGVLEPETLLPKPGPKQPQRTNAPDSHRSLVNDPAHSPDSRLPGVPPPKAALSPDLWSRKLAQDPAGPWAERSGRGSNRTLAAQRIFPKSGARCATGKLHTGGTASLGQFFALKGGPACSAPKTKNCKCRCTHVYTHTWVLKLGGFEQNELSIPLGVH